MSLYILWNSISFSFSRPVKETGYIWETFDFLQKPAYATLGIQELIREEKGDTVQFVLSAIFQAYKKEAQKQPLDYLQVLTINGVEVWIIDDGAEICLMTKGEY